MVCLFVVLTVAEFFRRMREEEVCSMQTTHRIHVWELLWWVYMATEERSCVSSRTSDCHHFSGKSIAEAGLLQKKRGLGWSFSLIFCLWPTPIQECLIHTVNKTHFHVDNAQSWITASPLPVSRGTEPWGISYFMPGGRQKVTDLVVGCWLLVVLCSSIST